MVCCVCIKQVHRARQWLNRVVGILKAPADGLRTVDIACCAHFTELKSFGMFPRAKSKLFEFAAVGRVEKDDIV